MILYIKVCYILENNMKYKYEEVIEQIPTELELMSLFNVSRHRVRKVISGL